MYQQQLLHMAAMYGWIPQSDEDDKNDDEPLELDESRTRLPLKHRSLACPGFTFLTPRAMKRLNATELRHLQEHYITHYSLSPSAESTKLKFQDLSPAGSIWGRCQDMGCQLVYGSQYAQRKRAGKRLNSFACLEHEVDTNARFRAETRTEHMVPVEFYGDIRYFFLHKFEGVEHVLVYVGWIHHSVEAGAVQDRGAWVDGFTCVESLQRLVGRVKVGVRLPKTFIVEAVCDVMVERLRDALP
jgi:hypothetical protein